MSASVPYVTLRALGPEDASVMAAWGGDPEFCLAADWSVGVPHAERTLFFSRLIAAPPVGLIRLAALDEGVLVGYVDLRGTDSQERELGFVIGERARWGHGLGRAAASAGCRHGFRTLGLRLIRAEADAANVGSVAILQGLGMDEMHADDPDGLRRFSITHQAWQD